MGKKLKKYYAVKRGIKPGIYYSWEECNAQVHKFKNPLFKSFTTLSEAQEFMKPSNENDSSNSENPTFAYIDGSFNKLTKIYGYGGFLMHNNQKYIIKGNGNEPYLVEMRNVAGEIIACREAVKKAIELGAKSIDIFYDYSGIEEWANGTWKRNKKGTKEYYEYMQSIKSKININFKKVEGHTGVKGNEEADKIAKEAAGINDNDSNGEFNNIKNMSKRDNNDTKMRKVENNKVKISPIEIKHINKNIKRRKIHILHFKKCNDKILDNKSSNDKIKNFIQLNKEKEKEKEKELNEKNNI